MPTSLDLQKFLDKVKQAEKGHQLDLSSDEDLSIGVMNLIAIGSQELALLTGAVEAMVVDVQCIMQALGDLSARFHTKLITTSPKAHITGATRVEFDEHHAPEIARQIVRMAVDNYPSRNGHANIPPITNELVPGFSHEYINYMQGGTFRGSFRPLNDAVIAGR